MNTTLILTGIIAWFTISSAYFLCNMGNKNMKEPWYIWIFVPPVFLLSCLFRAGLEMTAYIKRKFKK